MNRWTSMFYISWNPLPDKLPPGILRKRHTGDSNTSWNILMWHKYAWQDGKFVFLPCQNCKQSWTNVPTDDFYHSESHIDALQDVGTVCKPSPNMSSNDGQWLSENFWKHHYLFIFGYLWYLYRNELSNFQQKDLHAKFPIVGFCWF